MSKIVMIEPDDFKEAFKSELIEELSNLINSRLSNQKEQPSQNKYVTRSEVCKMLSVSLPTVDQISKEGILKAHKIKNRVLFVRSEVEQAVEKGNTNIKNRRLKNGNFDI